MRPAEHPETAGPRRLRARPAVELHAALWMSQLRKLSRLVSQLQNFDAIRVMFGPDWKAGCPSCAMIANAFNGSVGDGRRGPARHGRRDDSHHSRASRSSRRARRASHWSHRRLRRRASARASRRPIMTQSRRARVRSRDDKHTTRRQRWRRTRRETANSRRTRRR
jgi:hypothetical protein